MERELRHGLFAMSDASHNHLSQLPELKFSLKGIQPWIRRVATAEFSPAFQGRGT